MKVSITFKTPDAVQNALKGMRSDLNEEAKEKYPDRLDEERWEWVEEKLSEYEEKLNKMIRYGELITIEFDLEKGTATVAK
jgi:hypothetical protein